MKKMRPDELIRKIENEPQYKKWSSYIPRLKLLSKKHSDVVVGLYIDGDDDEFEGELIAPISEDGNPDYSRKRILRSSEDVPFIFLPDREISDKA